MNPQVQTLIEKAQAALKGQPALGGTINVNFGSDGQVLIGNEVDPCISYNAPGFVVTADCTITLSFDTLAKLESGDASVTWSMIDGDLKVDGDRGLAEKFGTIVAAAKG